MSRVSQFGSWNNAAGFLREAQGSLLSAVCCRLWDSSQTDAISRRGTQQNGRKFLLSFSPAEEILFFFFLKGATERFYKYANCSDHPGIQSVDHGTDLEKAKQKKTRGGK